MWSRYTIKIKFGTANYFNKISGLKKNIFFEEEDNIIIQIIKKKEYISMKNLYEDTINILNLEREQFNHWKENIIKENIIKENELNSSSQSKKINKLNCEIESLKLGRSSNLK